MKERVYYYTLSASSPFFLVSLLLPFSPPLNIFNLTITMSNLNLYSHDTIQILQDPNNIADPQVPLHNLSLVRTRIDSLRSSLSQSINTNSPLTSDQITVVSNQIISSIHHTIVNAAALVSYSQNLTVAAPSVFPPNNPRPESSSAEQTKHHQALNSKIELAEDDEDVIDEDYDGDYEIVEIDAVELLAEHIHFCEICGKGFRRDANLRMHMRAHGNQFKTLEALAKPSEDVAGSGARRRPTRFSCPFEGCTRNKLHLKFRSLKSVVCVKNHFKRSHCPKMYACNRCHKKNFSVLSDLKSHMRHCGESKWKCSCGTTFSRKDKLFGHIALFEGHMPLLPLEEEEKGKRVVVEEESEVAKVVMEGGLDNRFMADGLPEQFFDDFGSIDDYCFMLDE